MPISILASAIYDVLRPMVPGHNVSITYTELVNALPLLPQQYANLQARDPRLDEALGELVHACRAQNLPAISALVVRNDTKQPGNGYYGAAHPGVDDDEERTVAWGHEAETARQTEYPEHLDD